MWPITASCSNAARSYTGPWAQPLRAFYAERLTEHEEELPAYHYERGEVWEKALEYFIKAGQKLQQAYANREALAHYDRAVAVRERLGERVELATLLQIYAGKWIVHWLLSEFLPAIDAGQRLLAVARQLGKAAQEAGALLDRY